MNGLKRGTEGGAWAKEIQALEAEAQRLRDETHALDVTIGNIECTVTDIEHALTRKAALGVRMQAVQGKLQVSRDKEAAAARAQLETEIRRNEAALHTFTTGALIDALFAADAALIKAEGLLLEGNRLRMELSGGATLWGNPYDRPKRDIERNIATLDPSRFDYTTGGLMEKQRNNKR